MTELKIVPTLDHEKLVVCEEATAFKPLKENMNALRSLFDEMLEEEQENKNIVIRKIELSKALSMEIPLSDYENLPLCDVERTLRWKVEGYRKIKDSCLNRLAELKSKADLLCNDLGIQPQADFQNEVPSEQQLNSVNSTCFQNLFAPSSRGTV
jgi:hypothetical protein